MAVARSCTVLHDEVSHLLVQGRAALEFEYDTVMTIQVVSCDDRRGQRSQVISHCPCCLLLENASCIDEKGQCFQKKNNKPTIIPPKDLDYPELVRQKASCSLTLAYVLPLVLGENLDTDDPHYRHFLGMIQVVVFAFSPFADDACASKLEQLLHSYCTQFKHLYPNSTIKPKMHYMLHLVEQVRAFGPLRSQNTFRFEGKHGLFKSIGWKNFVNLPLSMLDKHQLILCNKMVNADGSYVHNFVYPGDDVQQAKGKVWNIHTFPHLEAAIEQAEGTVFETVRLSCKGCEYRCGAALVLDDKSYGDPKFGAITHIFDHGGKYFFQIQELKTCSYEPRYNAYSVVCRIDKFQAIALSSLSNKFPLPIYLSHDGLHLVTLRHSFRIPGY